MSLVESDCSTKGSRRREFQPHLDLIRMQGSKLQVIGCGNAAVSYGENVHLGEMGSESGARCRRSLPPLSALFAPTLDMGTVADRDSRANAHGCLRCHRHRRK